MLQVEFGLMVMTAPFSFAFLSVDALRDQGIAPFKSLLSWMYRVIVCAVIFSAYVGVNDVARVIADKYAGAGIDSIANSGTMIKVMIAANLTQFLLLILLWKSDSIAANLSSGATNLSSSDVTGAIMAGAAAANLAKGVGDAATKPLQGMNDWTKQAFGNSGVGVNNASEMGTGGAGTELLKPEAPSMSMADSGGGNSMNSTAVPAEAASNAAAINDWAANTPGGTTNGSDVNAYGGTPNPLPDKNARDPERDAAREARRQAIAAKRTQSSSGADAGIGGGGTAPGTAPGATLSDRLGNLHHHLSQDKATVGVSVNPHHD